MGGDSYRKSRNASVIVLSHSFNKAVRKVRSDLDIPAEGFNSGEEAIGWYERHNRANTEESLKPRPAYYWHFPKEFVELVESFSYTSKPSRVNFYPDVPLDRYAMDLVRKFDLPEEVVGEVKAHILTGSKALGTGEALQLILLPINEAEEGTKYVALVAGIDESTTQKDWLEIWSSMRSIFRLQGLPEVPHKRPVDRIFLRDLTFWKYVKEGKTAQKALKEWCTLHPEDEKLGEDTVRKAVERIDKIMQSRFSA